MLIMHLLAIYPTNDQDSAAAFLLALRAKGYHPQVIVTREACARITAR